MIRQAKLLFVVVQIIGFSAWAQNPIQVVATTGMIGDVAGQLLGTCGDVETLMGPGTDPHAYTATNADVTALRNADLILYNGLGLEGSLADVLEALAARQPTLAYAEAAAPEGARLRGARGGSTDPHVWMNVALWADGIPTLTNRLSELAPDCRDGIEARGSAYAATLRTLHAWVEEAYQSVPSARRVLVTAHDAFGYLGGAYGVEVVGIQGLSSASEASVGDVRRVADVLVERDVPAIFVESTINPRTVEAVTNAAASRGANVRIGGLLYADAMGDPGTLEGTYVGMTVHNTMTIADALGGTTPPLPEVLKQP
jgi:manganese/zinc/iron transport system substrate-binding protein